MSADPVIGSASPDVADALYRCARQAIGFSVPAHVEVVTELRSLMISVMRASPEDPKHRDGCRWHVRIRVDAEQVQRLGLPSGPQLDAWLGTQEGALNVLCVASSYGPAPFQGLCLRHNMVAPEDPHVGHITTRERYRQSLWMVGEYGRNA